MASNARGAKGEQIVNKLAQDTKIGRNKRFKQLTFNGKPRFIRRSPRIRRGGRPLSPRPSCPPRLRLYVGFLLHWSLHRIGPIDQFSALPRRLPEANAGQPRIDQGVPAQPTALIFQPRHRESHTWNNISRHRYCERHPWDRKEQWREAV